MTKMLSKASLKQMLENRDTLVYETDKKLAALNKESGDIKESISFVMMSIYKISILFSYQVFLKENQHPPIKEIEIENNLYLLDDVLKYQINLCEHTHIALLQPELIENFTIFEDISSHVLYAMLIKQHYLLLLFKEYFDIGPKWAIKIETLIFNLAKVSRNYCNVKAFINKQRETRKDIEIIERTIQKAVEFQKWAGEQAYQTWSLEKNNFYGSIVVQYWNSTYELYKIFAPPEEVKQLKTKIEGIEQRINQESEK